MGTTSHRILKVSCALGGAGLCVLLAGGQAAPGGPKADPIQANADLMLAEGRHTFRFDTFGDEAFWGGSLRLHETVAQISPAQALSLGLKVDANALPPETLAALRNGHLNLDDPAVTQVLLRHNAVVGVQGFFSGASLSSVGITCALCHSTVDNSVAPGVGSRLDGWANRDLNVGAIIASAPNVGALAQVLGVPVETARTVLQSWGPGKFDAQLILDGRALRPDGLPAATLLPPAFGLAGVNQHTWTGGWGNVTHWNAFVANLEMGGQGTFFDPRLNDPVKYPIAAANGFSDVRRTPDRISPKLGALHFYQLAIPAPAPPSGSFNAAAAARGALVFTAASCSRCHVPPSYTEPGCNTHTPEEIGIDGFQASRSPDEVYRTAPLRGLWTHTRGGFYHDGRFATLMDVVIHYNNVFDLHLNTGQMSDLVEYLKSL